MMSEAEIILASEPDYDGLFAEIYFRGKFFARLSCDDGTIMLETPGPGLNEAAILHSVELCDFLHAVERARQRLLG
ncbi:MAG TPA: hypothetical protein VGN12_06780 [Pirellulales bacterium]|jgi:hypothetical protein